MSTKTFYINKPEHQGNYSIEMGAGIAPRVTIVKDGSGTDLHDDQKQYLGEKLYELAVADVSIKQKLETKHPGIFDYLQKRYTQNTGISDDHFTTEIFAKELFDLI